MVLLVPNYRAAGVLNTREISGGTARLTSRSSGKLLTILQRYTRTEAPTINVQQDLLLYPPETLTPASTVAPTRSTSIKKFVAPTKIIVPPRIWVYQHRRLPRTQVNAQRNYHRFLGGLACDSYKLIRIFSHLEKFRLSLDSSAPQFKQENFSY